MLCIACFEGLLHINDVELHKLVISFLCYNIIEIYNNVSIKNVNLIWLIHSKYIIFILIWNFSLYKVMDTRETNNKTLPKRLPSIERQQKETQYPGWYKDTKGKELWSGEDDEVP